MHRKTLIAVLFLARSAFSQTDNARTKMDEAMRAGAVFCKAEDKAEQVGITCPINSVSLADLVKALPANGEQDKPVEVVFPMGDSWKLTTSDIKNIREINELLEEGITKGQGGHVRFYVEDKNESTSNRIGTGRMISGRTLFMMSTAYMEQQGSISTAIAIKKGLVSWQMQK